MFIQIFGNYEKEFGFYDWHHAVADGWHSDDSLQ